MKPHKTSYLTPDSTSDETHRTRPLPIGGARKSGEIGSGEMGRRRGFARRPRKAGEAGPLTPELYSAVLDAVQVAMSDAVQRRTGGLGADPLLVFEVEADGQVRVLIGERLKMVPALLHDGIVDASSQTFLGHAAPAGYAWCVLVWPGDSGETSIVLFPQPEKQQAGAPN
jgi:hypothetical protein